MIFEMYLHLSFRIQDVCELVQVGVDNFIELSRVDKN